MGIIGLKLFGVAIALFGMFGLSPAQAQHLPPPPLRVMMGQIRVTPGGFQPILDQAVQLYAQALRRKAHALVLPEGLFPGYPSMDLLTMSDYIDRAELAASALCEATRHGNTVLIFGHIVRNPRPRGRALQNVVSVCKGGQLVHRQAKILLPTYGPFDDSRYFEPGRLHEIQAVDIDGFRVVIGICEDLWYYDKHDGRIIYTKNTIQRIRALHPDLVISTSASPWNIGKLQAREEVHGDVARRVGAPVMWVNQYGVVDHLNFDGSSFVLNAQGKRVFRLKSWAPDSEIVQFPFDSRQAIFTDRIEPARSQQNEGELADILAAIETGLREYIPQIGHNSVVFGLSGGLDSAMAAAFSVRALGADHVFVIKMPSDYSSEGSITDSDQLIKNLGIPPQNVLTLPIREMMTALGNTLREAGLPFEDLEKFDGGRVAIENLQARTRMMLEFFISNLTGSMKPEDTEIAKWLTAHDPRWAAFISRRAAKIATSDKSELAVGNGTIFGDVAGVLAVNGDLYKTELWDLGYYINQISGREVIPLKILTKDPTPELLGGQLTTDKFPPYRVIDPILIDLIENNFSPDQLRSKYLSFDERVPEHFRHPTLVDFILKLYARSEFKRELAQMPVIRVHARAFGKERRVTNVAQKFSPLTAAEINQCLRHLQ
jgi:NH3-dependent NAD+ synthetase/predicted amidohydrolase